MKKILLLLAVLALPLSALGQQRITFGQLQKKYSGQEGFATIEITETMLKLLGSKSNGDKTGNMLSGISGIRGISIITSENKNDAFIGDLQQMVDTGSGYKLLTSVEENGSKAQFYYKDVDEEVAPGQTPRISELVMILYGGADNLAMNILGDFSIKQITSIADQAASGDGINLNF